jgi:hypothetical protein
MCQDSTSLLLRLNSFKAARSKGKELRDCSSHQALLACNQQCKRLCMSRDGVPFVEREVVLTIRIRRLAGATTLQTDVFFRAAQACAWRQVSE